MEEQARKLTKVLYGNNYDHSHYEKILNCLHDFKKFMESLYANIMDLREFHKQE